MGVFEEDRLRGRGRGGMCCFLMVFYLFHV
jgi:hypothetical protein